MDAVEALTTRMLTGMTLQDQYDRRDVRFQPGGIRRGDHEAKGDSCGGPRNFDAQLSMGMAYYRKGDYETAITEGHKAEKLKPNEQLVHTNRRCFT